MHINTVQVTSVRQDGTAFKCTVPEDGEVWMTVPDNMHGHVEWKKTYRIGWTKNPRKNGGFFYNLKQLQSVDEQAPTAGHNNPPVVKAGNGKGEIDIRSIFGLMHSYNGNLPAPAQMLRDLRNAEMTLRAFVANEDVVAVENIEDTY